ncbi:BLUF domain-containing protein [Vibrio sonorensis]|uniref:BLUF domain-containing protein n=1 Tax=Vibrio sonorensis TaxID=1004316 RepID=UPI0008DA0987|nr:BLUF domain-containing protein [Vibrio sonorensis]
MYLVRLIYASRISDGMSNQDIENILESARKNNRKENVTGVLLFNRNYFLQCIEGSRSKVNQIYHKILNDQRHQEIVILSYDEINKRDFSDWHMGYIPETAVTMPITQQFSSSEIFNPYEISGASAHGLLLTLKEAIKTI